MTKLVKLLEANGFQLKWRQQGEAIRVGTKAFRPSHSPQDLVALSSSEGLLLSRSTKEQRESLRARNINYLDPKGYLYMTLGPSTTILIEEHRSKKKNLEKKRQQQIAVSPTLLVSPNGLALVDALLRTSPQQLQETRSTLEFCRMHSLYQPKASKIMTGLRAKNLLDLRSKLQELPIEWWMFAFDSPATKRKMLAFFDVAQNYYSVSPDIEVMSEEELQKKLNSEFGDDVTGGPTLVAKQVGALIDPGISLWVSPDAASKLKRDFKLVAGKKPNHRTWQLASPTVTLRKAELISHVRDSATMLSAKTNVMRAIWDLSFSESRLREIRADLLRSLLR